MAYIRGFGSWLPDRIVTNAEIAERVGKTPEWIEEVSGIRERRYAGPDDSVAAMAVNAARNCLERLAGGAADIGMLIVSSGTSELQFPGPAANVARQLGLGIIPAIDLPVASAGSIFGMVLASKLAAVYGNILVVASEKMSAAVDPADANTAILFGDGAGACLISSQRGSHQIAESVLHSDGSFAADLRLKWNGVLEMNGMTVILQASRKLPSVIQEVVAAGAATVDRFILHQANQNLILRVAKSLGVPPERFHSNIARYGNTSSASMLIAASECGIEDATTVCFAGFGAGFHWGALLATAIS